MSDYIDSFNRTTDDAKSLFTSLNGKDPLEYIKPALLNSADIYAYADKTSMVWPFNSKNLKSASYEVDFLGTVIYWDEDGKKVTVNISENDTFILKKHSIAFVSPELIFRLPEYLAVRFNLQIKLVHSGILLGTGPLVDPGFEGTLLIPLHNLTNNDYALKGGEGLIWVEFTKTSENSRWMAEQEITEYGDKYVTFPSDKKYKKPEEFIGKALAGQTFNYIHSSIPTAILKAAEVENNVKEIEIYVKDELYKTNEKVNTDIEDHKIKSNTTIDNLKDTFVNYKDQINDKIDKKTTLDKIAVGAFIITIAALFVSLMEVHTGTRSLVQDANNNFTNNQKYFQNISALISNQNKKIESLELKLQNTRVNK